MSKITFLILSVLALSLVGPRAAFADNTQTDFQSWVNANAFIKLFPDRPWSLYIEAQPRFGDESSRLERLLLRSAVGYSVSPKLSLWLGYAYTPLFMNAHYADDFRDERRIWQQALYTDSIFSEQLILQLRLRQEQRFIEDSDGGVANRTRLMLRLSHAVGKIGEIALGPTGYFENFTNLNSIQHGPIAGFDRNRFFTGFYGELSPTRVELGYVGEYGNHFGNDDRYITGILTNITFNF